MQTRNKQILIAGGIAALVTATLLLRFRQTIPKNVKAVKNFKKEQYLGKWYEIARLDYFYERYLNNISAEYSLNSNGTIRVINKGYNYKKNKFEEARGEAKFVAADKEAKLKVTFFKPFYSGYNVIAIDNDYKNALVAGRNLNYLWLLSREKSMHPEIKETYLHIAQSYGYNTDKLIWVEHNI